MSYVETLDVNQKKAIELMVKSMVKRGITNKYMHAGIMAVVSKESGFKPKSEGGYGGTSIARIRKIFSSRVADLSDAELEVLKKDNEAFFNRVYGGKYGNGPDEGYKYRGRGLNQITFKGNYEAMAKYTDADIVGNPDLLNTLEVAVDVCIGYFLRNFSKKGAKLDEYNMTSINDAKSLKDAAGAAYHANAGWGKSKASIETDPTDGYKRTMDRMGELLTVAESIDTNGVMPENFNNNSNSGANANSGSSNSGNSTTPVNTSGGISASVGKGGKNKNADVKIVQALLNEKEKAGLKVDGDCGPKTIAAITKFQKDKVGLASPDGRIDLGGKTWKELTEAPSGSGGTESGEIQVVPTSLDATVFPCFN
jgi:predicted chitinase